MSIVLLILLCLSTLALGLLSLILLQHKEQKVLIVVTLSLIGHILGTYIYSLYPSDSTTTYFPKASPEWHGLSTRFVITLTWYTRHFITGNSIIDTFYFFTIFAFLGSILWYALYLAIAKHASQKKLSAFAPALILMCWPSSLLFSAGIGKDSLSFCFIPLMLLSFQKILIERKIAYISFLIISLTILTLIRPYLLMITLLTLSLYLLKKPSKANMKPLAPSIITFMLFLCAAAGVLKTQGHLQHLNIESILNKIVYLQNSQSIGSFFPLPSNNSPIIRLLLFPYSFAMNLLFPLGFFARNFAGYIASTENFILLFIILSFFISKKHLIKKTLSTPFVKFILLFFFAGVSLLALSNNNLGFSTREKLMYLPAFLIIYCIMLLQRRTQ